ncbi:MAG: hypothetical protein PHR56_02110 [Dehalococcoidales bacterium]|nr:hypothetical protein [Dehalococcoidales bacterium]
MSKMHRELRFTPTASEQLSAIENNPALKSVLKQVRKTLGYLETNLRAISLQTHKYESLTSRYKREVFEAYVQQNTPGAYRVFWHYGDDETDNKGKRIPIITIIAIVPHPDD